MSALLSGFVQVVAGAGGPVGRPPHLRELLRIRAFAALYAAEVQSVAGDQLARVALSVLVFEQTNSSAMTALTYAATFLPAVLGGFVLAGAGDRYPRRRVLVASDAFRMAVFALMAIPAVPLPGVVALLVLAVFVGPAHSAAQVSYLAQALVREEFRAATGVRLATNQAAQVIGFGVGGGIVAVIGPHLALVLDAATFLLAAVLIAVFLPALPAPARPGEQPAQLDGDEYAQRSGEQDTVVWSRPAERTAPWQDRAVRTAIGLSWLQGFFVAPEGLAVPFAKAVGAGTTEVGLLLAALPFGGALGAVLVTRLVRPDARRPVSRAMAVATGVPLVVSALHLPLPAVLVAWAVSGVLSSYQLEAMNEIVHAVPAAWRARTVGRISAGLITAQGLGLAVFGVLAQLGGVRAAVAWAGAVGLVLASMLVLLDRPVRRSQTPARQSSVRVQDSG